MRLLPGSSSLRFARFIAVCCAVVLWAGFSGAVGAGRVRKPRPRLGMNLAGPCDWNTELPFVDVFRMSRPWISQQQGKKWGKGPPLDLDERGWVRRLAPNCWAETLMCTIKGGHYPGGRYTVLYKGCGRIEFGGAASVIERQPGRIVIEVRPEKGAIFLRLKETDPSDYVRDIHVIMPGFEKTWRSNPFHPQFLRRWRGVACFRFMDWMKTNGSKVRSWSDRPRLNDAAWSLKGVPVEIMVDLCNRLHADAWFCMPHMCDDDYVRRFAALVRERLTPDLRVYVEYSNEVWNSLFPQTRYAGMKGRELGLGDKERPWEGGGMYYARRSVQIFRIWEEEFGDPARQTPARLVRVLAWQAGNAWWLRNIILPTDDAGRRADAVAIAPYFHLLVPPKASKPGRLTADETAGWSVDRLLDYVEQHALPQAVENMRKTKEAADEYGLTMIAYEGGQHLVGVRGGENNKRLTQLFMQANAHPRMGALYTTYLDAWVKAGGDLFCHFSSVGRWSKWGCWGLLQYYDDDATRSPKFMAVMRWVRSLGQPVTIPTAAPGP